MERMTRAIVDLILVSHNSKKDLEKFLPNLKENTQNHTLTIVDNSDDRETIDYLDELTYDMKFDDYIRVLTIENKGYGNACNQGAVGVESEFIVFMNCDLEVMSNDWLDLLLKPFEDKKVAITGARLFNPNGNEYPTAEKDFMIGCVFAMRRSVYDELKGFDEKFFLFFEETDMCKRALDAGYKVIRSEAKFIHYNPHFKTQIEANPFLKKCWDESKAYFEVKHRVMVGGEKKKMCLVGIPCGSGMFPAYAVDGLFKLSKPCATSLLIIERQAVDKARNYIIEMALRLQVDYIFFADDDGVLPPDALVKLMEDDKDIVGAPMMTRNKKENGKHALCVFEKYDFYIGDGRSINKYRSIEKLDTTNGKYLFSVDAIGGACFLIKKNAFEALFTQYDGRPFEFLRDVFTTKEHGVTVRDISEDMCFSERAKRAGFEIFVDTRVRPVHLGKPEFVRFEQEGEALPTLKEPLKGCITLSENLGEHYKGN